MFCCGWVICFASYFVSGLIGCAVGQVCLGWGVRLFLRLV